jgi:hypothetical protein
MDFAKLSKKVMGDSLTVGLFVNVASNLCKYRSISITVGERV